MFFKQFRDKFQANAAQVFGNRRIFKLDVGDSEAIWEAYLGGFSEENRQLYNCNACHRFFRYFGGLVTISDAYELTTLWDFESDSYFQPSVDAVRSYLSDKRIKEALAIENKELGIDKNASKLGWHHHLYLELPQSFRLTITPNIGSLLNDSRTGKAVYQRALEEVTQSAVDTVLDLIHENALYRGEEFKDLLMAFKQAKIKYESLNESGKENLCWLQERGALSDIRSSVIGTLIVDLSEPDANVEQAVKAYEFKVAPTNYQRPKAVVTGRMLDDAKATLESLGLERSIYRRFALPTDLNVTDLLFVWRVSGIGNIFEEAKKDIDVDISKFKSVPTLTLQELLNQIQTANSLEILLENEQEANMFSLVTATYPDSPSLFKWSNQFSWTYNNGVADSIRERVKKAGGNISGLIRVSLAWNTQSDLDLHIEEPKHHIYYGAKISPYTKANLDVDANASTIVPNPVENIIYPHQAKMLEGEYSIYVENFRDRELTDNFTVEIEMSGTTHTYVHNGIIRVKQKVPIAKFSYVAGTLKLQPSVNMSTTGASKELWGLRTYRFVRVLSAFYSPNYWGENAVGNKHVFFQLEGATNTSRPFPFFNEQIDSNLTRNHKRVFEVLGSKLTVENNGPQVSGLGFSTTNPATFLCKLDGKVIKVTN
jgi:hypothetical protein